MKESNDIDRLFRDSLYNREVDYNPGDWREAEKLLDQSKEKRFALYRFRKYLLALLALFLISSGMFYFLRNKEAGLTINEKITTNETSSSQTSETQKWEGNDILQDQSQTETTMAEENISRLEGNSVVPNASINDQELSGKSTFSEKSHTSTVVEDNVDVKDDHIAEVQVQKPKVTSPKREIISEPSRTISIDVPVSKEVAIEPETVENTGGDQPDSKTTAVRTTNSDQQKVAELESNSDSISSDKEPGSSLSATDQSKDETFGTAHNPTSTVNTAKSTAKTELSGSETASIDSDINSASSEEAEKSTATDAPQSEKKLPVTSLQSPVQEEVADEQPEPDLDKLRPKDFKVSGLRVVLSGGMTTGLSTEATNQSDIYTYGIGLGYEKLIYPSFSVEARILLNRRNGAGLSYTAEEVRYDFGVERLRNEFVYKSLLYVEVPVFVNYFVQPRHQVGLGLRYGRLLRANYDHFTSSSGTLIEEDERSVGGKHSKGPFNGNDLSVMLGYQFILNDRVKIGVNGQYGMTNLVNTSFVSGQQVFNHQLRLQLTYKLLD